MIKNFYKAIDKRTGEVNYVCPGHLKDYNRFNTNCRYEDVINTEGINCTVHVQIEQEQKAAWDAFKKTPKYKVYCEAQERAMNTLTSLIKELR